MKQPLAPKQAISHNKATSKEEDVASTTTKQAEPDEEILFRPQQQRDIVWRWQTRRRVRRRVA